jgi:FMN reductase
MEPTLTSVTAAELIQPNGPVTVLVGNPKPRSRTYEAAHVLVDRLTGGKPDSVIDLADVGPGLLDWNDETVAELVRQVKETALLVVASPTYKATYTGLLKLFLDRFAAGSLAAVTAVPLMLGGHWKHGLAPELLLKPVLVEIGAVCPVPGLFLLDSDYAQATELESWVQAAREPLNRSLAR